MLPLLLPAASSVRGVDLEPVEEDPPESALAIDQGLVGDTAVLREQGELQITFGISLENEDDKDTTELFVDIEYGLTDWLEVGFTVPYLFVQPDADDESDVDGLSDVAVSVSVSLLDAPVLVSTSLEVSFPTGNHHKSDDLGEGCVVFEPMVNLGLEIGIFELALGVGGEFSREQDGAFLFDAALACELQEDVVAAIGVEGNIDRDQTELLLTPGFGFEVVDDVELAFEVGIGLNPDSPNWQLTIELSFEF